MEPHMIEKIIFIGVFDRDQSCGFHVLIIYDLRSYFQFIFMLFEYPKMIQAIIKIATLTSISLNGFIAPFHSPAKYAQTLLIINARPSNIGQPTTGPICPIKAAP